LNRAEFPKSAARVVIFANSAGEARLQRRPALVIGTYRRSRCAARSFPRAHPNPRAQLRPSQRLRRSDRARSPGRSRRRGSPRTRSGLRCATRDSRRQPLALEQRFRTRAPPLRTVVVGSGAPGARAIRRARAVRRRRRLPLCRSCARPDVAEVLVTVAFAELAGDVEVALAGDCELQRVLVEARATTPR
jgi:hypothetical protein